MNAATSRVSLQALTKSIKLSQDETRLVMAHRNMSAETGAAALNLVESFASITRKAPSLHLIVGGAA